MLRGKLTYANVMATVAVFVALGGGAYAATQINGARLRNRSVSGAKIRRNALTGTEIRESRVGKVPKAVNADTLGGQPPASYRLQCPAGLNTAADVCYEPTVRVPTTWEAAIATCARAQRRLPTAPELALVFDHGGATQPNEFTATAYTEFRPNPPQLLATYLSQNAARQLAAGATDRAIALQYRCVTSPGN
jgi:hypothetical protein